MLCSSTNAERFVFQNGVRLTLLDWQDGSLNPTIPPRVLEYVLRLNYSLCCSQVNACYVTVLAEIGHLSAIFHIIDVDTLLLCRV